MTGIDHRHAAQRGHAIGERCEVFANIEVMHVQVAIDQFRAEPQPNLHTLAGENASLGPEVKPHAGDHQPVQGVIRALA